MLIKKIIFIGSFCLISNLLFSQDNKDVYIKKMHVTNLKHTTVTTGASNFGNSVFVNQIGEENFQNTTGSSVNSNQIIMQHGSYNYSDSYLNTENINTTVSQSGVRNNYNDYSIRSHQAIDLELIQQGENLSFDRFGVNATTKNLKVKMKGNDRTVIVRSFN